MSFRSRRVRASRLVPRPRLLRLLRPHWKVAVLSAPAGYGKTTLAMQYASGKRALWCRLCPEDRDPAHLMGTLLGAGKALHPPVGHRTSLLFLSRRDMERDGGILTASLLGEMVPARGERLIVLDDVHVLSGAAASLRWLRRVMEESGPRVRFLLTCRGECPLPLARFDLRGGTLLLGVRELEFTEDEQARLLRGVFGPRAPILESTALRATLGGWAAGLVLASQSMSRKEKRRPPKTVDEGGDGDRTKRLLDLFAEEVFDALPSRLQSALCRAALLDDLDAAAVRALLGPRETAYLLREITRRALFLRTLPDGGATPRFHPLFLEFLRRRLHECTPRAERRALLRRLARHWDRRAEPVRSLRVLLEIGDGASIHPSLLIRAAIRLRDSGEMEESARLARQAQDAFAARGAWLSAARALRTEAMVAVITGRVQSTLEHALSLAALIPAKERAARGLTALDLGDLCLQAGRPRESRAALIEAERWLRGTRHSVEAAEASLFRGTIAFTEGHWDIYLRLARQALQTYRRAGYLTKAQSVLINMAEAHIYLGEEEEALALLDEAGLRNESPGLGPYRASEATGRGRALSEMGLLRKAIPHFHKARSLSRASGMEMNALYVNVWEGVCLRRLGRLKKAAELLERAAEGFARAESPSWLAVSRMEHALVSGLCGATEEALETLVVAARVSRRLGDRKELARNFLYEARLLQAADRAFEAPLLRALRILVRENYVVLLRKEGDVAVPLLAAALTLPSVPSLVRRILPALSTEVREAVSRQVAIAGRPHIARSSGPAPRINQTAARPPAEKLHIRLLGTFEVRGEQLLRFPRRASVALVAYLALRPGRPVAREVLAEALWPEASAVSSRNRFDVALSAARSVLEPHAGSRGPFRILVTDAGFCRLDENLVTVDKIEFERLARECEPVLRTLSYGDWKEPGGSGAKEVRSGEVTLRRALERYGGDLLPGLADAPWTQAERDRLRDRYHRLLLGMSALALRTGRAAEAEEAAQNVLRDDPLHEEALRLLLQAVVVLDGPAAVMQKYQHFRRAIERELGTTPSPQTVSLARELSVPC